MIKTTPSYILLVPVLGVIIFFILYAIAAVEYPGGSAVDPNSTSFSVINNYWCDLLAERTPGGTLNEGRRFSMTAMFVLCPTLMVFFYVAPEHIQLSYKTRTIAQICGILSMMIALAIFTSLHSYVIAASGSFGLIALVIIFAGLYRLNMKKIFWTGIASFVLIAANNFIYYSRIGVIILPLLQKITFVLFLLWVATVCIYLYRREVRHRATSDPVY
jgi:hypothetical protein